MSNPQYLVPPSGRQSIRFPRMQPPPTDMQSRNFNNYIYQQSEISYNSLECMIARYA